MFAINGIHDWGSPPPGELVTWNPSPVTLAKVREAPESAVPISYQQAQHLRGYSEYAARGSEMARLFILSWDIPGRCDIRAMTHVINSYLRRHDTYHSWFDFKGAGRIVRRTISDPKDIKLVPTKHGEITPEDWRTHVLATPDPFRWDCFHFGAIQREDHFTFFASVDHVHTDAVLVGQLMVEIHMMYDALAKGAAPIQLPETGSYDDYCAWQQEYLSALTLESPGVRAWVDFAQDNGGTMPHFPLPLGAPSVPATGDMITVRLLDGEQTERFESACVEAGVRFSGGVFACAAIAEHELTGADTYYVVTPITTRRNPAEFVTTGWYTGLVPITVPIGAAFDDIARAAQTSFDSGADLANVPFDHVLDMAPASLGLKRPKMGVPMISYIDTGVPPLSPEIIAQWDAMNGKLHMDARAANQIGMWVNRSEKETSVTVMFPDNAVARESIVRYMDVMKSAYVRVAEGREALVPFADVAQLDLKLA
jgi:hypothetical protein